MSKKKRRNNLFDLDEVKKRFDNEKNCEDSIRQQVLGLQKYDLVDIFVTKNLSFTEDETLQLLAAKLTFQGLCNLRKAIQQVLSNIRRVLAGKSLRASLIWDTFNALCLSTNCQPSQTTSVDELSRYVEIMESRCASFLSVRETQLRGQDGPREYISPPLSCCFKCDKLLSMHNKPCNATLFTLNGPILCGKVSLECRNCNVRYGICTYSDEAGTHLYPMEIDANKSLVEVSNVTYFEKSYRWIPSLSNHCWVSFGGFAEAYNETYEQQIIQYASHLETGSSTLERAEEAPEDQSFGILPGEISAKLVAKCFWQCEVEEELKERGLREKWIFAPNRSETNEHVGTHDDAMEYVDKKRCEELYNHKCSSHCKQKGCGKLYVADGNWKLRYAHCMWKVPLSVSGFGKINYPSICPLSPKRSHAFCNEHCEMAKTIGYETGLRDLYKRCGVAGVEVDQALSEMSSKPLLSDLSFDAVSTCLDEFVDDSSDRNIPNASTFQGTTDFLLNNPRFVEDNSVDSDLLCNKDTGGLKSLHFWSRGVFFIVSAGGHIEYWQPLYKC